MDFHIHVIIELYTHKLKFLKLTNDADYAKRATNLIHIYIFTKLRMT